MTKKKKPTKLNVREERDGVLLVSPEHMAQAEAEGLTLDELAEEMILEVDWMDSNVEAFK